MNVRLESMCQGDGKIYAQIAIERLSAKHGVQTDCLVQINIGREESKAGIRQRIPAFSTHAKMLYSIASSKWRLP